MLNQYLSIDDVEAQFDKWRRNKSKGDEKIPPELWAQVKILIKSNPHSKIAKKLGLTTKQLRNNQLLPTKDKTTKVATNSFVSLSIPPSKINQINQSEGSVLTIMSGEAKCIIANPTTEQFQLIIFKILG